MNVKTGSAWEDRFHIDKGWVAYCITYAIRHNGAHGLGTITNDVLNFKKDIEFESSCIVICFSYIYLIIDGKRSFINLESSQNFIKTHERIIRALLLLHS